MSKRNTDPEFDQDEILQQDPTGEQAFAEGGFEDGPDGRPILEAPGLEGPADKRTARHGQKVAGIPEELQHQSTTPSEDRPDTPKAVIRERGGAGKGDPAVGGTRPD